MSTTPEGRIKKKINQALDIYGEALHRYMPVPSGYGRPHLDYICCFRGLYFAIEAKRLEKRLTDRQEITRDEVKMAGGRVFEIYDDATLELLVVWLACVSERDVRL